MAKTKTQDNGATQEVDLSQTLETIKNIPFEQRKQLFGIINKAHSKDLDKASYGGEPDGEGYTMPETKETAA